MCRIFSVFITGILYNTEEEEDVETENKTARNIENKCAVIYQKYFRVFKRCKSNDDTPRNNLIWEMGRDGWTDRFTYR